MKKLIIFLMFCLFSYSGFSQEYDDMYFNRKDRRTVIQIKVSSTKYINPEYIERYSHKPKVETVVYTTTTYNRIRPHHYNNWSWNISFGYYPYNHYSWNPYYYDPFYMDYNYYSWYPHRYNHYSYYWHNPYRFNSWYGYSHYYHHNNYSYKHHYSGKQKVTTYKNNVKYQPRTNRSSAIRIPPKTRTSRSDNNRINQYNRTQNERIIRKSNSNNKLTRSSNYTKPSRQTNTNTYKRTNNTYKSNTYKRSTTPTRNYRGTSVGTSRSSVGTSRSYSAPSRSSGSSSGSRSSGGSSGGSRSSRGGRQ